MRRILVVFVGLAAVWLACDRGHGQACEADASARNILEQLQIPDDAHLPTAQNRELRLSLLAKSLAAAPNDIPLHEAYQNLRLAGMEVNRAGLIAEYERLLAIHPDDPRFLYVAAEAEMGRQTKQAIDHLQRAIRLAPAFGLPHFLLATIDSSQAYANAPALPQELQRFEALCPGSVRALLTLQRNPDQQLVRSEAARLRKNIEARTDSEAVAAYRTLWSYESALVRSDQQAENLARLRHDVERLLGPEFPRNAAWLAAMDAASGLDGTLESFSLQARHVVATLYPRSSAALDEEYDRAMASVVYPAQPTPQQMAVYWRKDWQTLLPLVLRWPNRPGLAGQAAEAVAQDRSATPQEVAQVITLFEHAFGQDPDAVWSAPPLPISVARLLVERGGPFDAVPGLVRAGISATERRMGEDTFNDLLGNSDGITFHRNLSYLDGYLSLAEATLRMGDATAAEQALALATPAFHQLQAAGTLHPSISAVSAAFAARFWLVEGLLAEKSGRKMDALVDDRNALTLYPPRSPGADDRRDEVMASEQRLWKELGGTSQGWNDWGSQSSLAGFYAGSGGSAAWAKLADASPDLVLTDSLGRRWSPRDLENKTTFITLWASWCLACRAELPWVEKLYQHFRDRQDIAVLALNVDDDPHAMTAALEELQVSVPSIAAADFAGSIVPVSGLPANWIITPAKTEMFAEDDDPHEVWLGKAVTAIEKAAGGSRPLPATP